LGGEATLLNAGKTTNFIYQVLDFKATSGEIESINEIDTRSKIKDRIEAIKSK
jgi:type II restriction enzyme